MAVAIPYLDASGAVKTRSVEADLFTKRARRVLLKEAVIMAEARQRVGTHSTKTRSEVNGTTAKMYRQKGTGNARHGTRKAPQFRGGGVAFAKKPRDYGWAMPKRARRAALRSAIRGKLDDNEVRVVADFGIKKPKTKDFIALLAKIDVKSSFLVVPEKHNEAVWMSCRNIPGAAYRVVSDLNAYEVLRQNVLIFEEAALKALEEKYGDA
ncbi:MAG: 50S ribosomal protein L4 [Planctomycetota bacterium]